jgi:hypothetical protein
MAVLTTDGTPTFDWDAPNQLVAFNEGIHRNEFSDDGGIPPCADRAKGNGESLRILEHPECGSAVNRAAGDLRGMTP